MADRFLTAVTGLATGDHLCWPFAGAEECVDAACQYAAEGLERNERVTLLDVGATGTFAAALPAIDGDGRHRDSGRLQVLTPPPEPPTGPGPLVLAAAAAVAEGFTGLRLMSNSTEQVRTEADRRAFARYEHQVDRAIQGASLTAVCGYDTTEVFDEVVADVACLHGLARGTSSPFLLHALPDDGHVALAGEVDATCATELRRAVAVCWSPSSEELVVDLSELEFIDHRGLLALDHAARRAHGRITLRAASDVVHWLVGTLGTTRLRSEPHP
jgi:anti-anti-sigma regulatory factor